MSFTLVDRFREMAHHAAVTAASSGSVGATEVRAINGTMYAVTVTRGPPDHGPLADPDWDCTTGYGTDGKPLGAPSYSTREKHYKIAWETAARAVRNNCRECQATGVTGYEAAFEVGRGVRPVEIPCSVCTPAVEAINHLKATMLPSEEA